MRRVLLVDNPPIRVRECRYGPMIYLSNDTYIGKSFDIYGECNESEFELYKQLIKPGMVVLDVGANIGAHTVYFSKLVENGLVFAVEPQPFIYQILCGNVAINALQNVMAYNMGLGETPTFTTMPRFDYSQKHNFGGISITDDCEQGYRVPINTIDKLSLSRCNFIKIDVEGMEIDVIKGGRLTIEKFQPILYVENDRDDKSEELIKLLMGFGYDLYWHMPGLYNPNNFYENKKDVFPNIGSMNILGVSRIIKRNMTGFKQIKSPKEKWQDLVNKDKEKTR